MFLSDYHTHSRFSFDGDPAATVDALCEAAIARGITDLAVTDHFECNFCEADFAVYDADKAEEAMMAAKKKYQNKLFLTYGIELGQANQYPKEAEKLLSRHPYEFVIGSIHNVTREQDFHFMDFKKWEDPSKMIGEYFDRVLEEYEDAIRKLQRIDTVGHLTYMHRYCAKAGIAYDFMRHREKMERLFHLLVKQDIALEVNTSTYWKGFGFTMPNREILSLYREAGGRLITVGTDSHSPEHLGEGVPEVYKMLHSLGLTDILVVRNGEKAIVKI